MEVLGQLVADWTDDHVMAAASAQSIRQAVENNPDIEARWMTALQAERWVMSGQRVQDGKTAMSVVIDRLVRAGWKKATLQEVFPEEFPTQEKASQQLFD